MVAQWSIKKNDLDMFDVEEMRRIINLSEEERKQNRENALKDAFSLRFGTNPVKDMDDLIHRVEDSVLELGDLTLERSEKDMFSPSIQAMLDEMIDVLNYLKSNKS